MWNIFLSTTTCFQTTLISVYHRRVYQENLSILIKGSLLGNPVALARSCLQFDLQDGRGLKKLGKSNPILNISVDGVCYLSPLGRAWLTSLPIKANCREESLSHSLRHFLCYNSVSVYKKKIWNKIKYHHCLFILSSDKLLKDLF